MISNFQTELKVILTEAEDMDLDIYAAITNSNIKFLGVLRDFMNSVSESTGQTIEQVSSSLSYRTIMTKFGALSNSSFIRIQDLIKDRLIDSMMKISSHKKLKLGEFLENTFLSMKVIFDKMYPTYAKKLWRFIFDLLTTYFCQYVIGQSLNYKPNEKEDFVQKLKEEIEITKDIFESIITLKFVADKLKKWEYIVEALESELENLGSSIVNLKVSLGPQYNEKFTKCILRLRTEFDKNEKDKIIETITNFKNEISDVSRKKQGAKLMTQSISTQFYVQQFVDNFKRKIQLKKEIQKKKENEKLKQDLMEINEIDRLEVEEQSINLRGYLGMVEKKLADPTKREKIINRVNKYKYSKFHFSFLDDIIQWKKKPTDKKAKGRLFLVTIEEISPIEQIYIVLKKQKKLFFLKAKDEAERKVWIQSIKILREESLSEIQHIEFEKFTCVSEANYYDELFDSDEINYSYEKIKIKKKENKAKKKFEVKEVKQTEIEDEENEEDEEGEKVINRSMEMLSVSDSEDEMEQGKNSEKKNLTGKISNYFKKELQELKKIKESKDKQTMFKKAKEYFGFFK